MVNRMVEKTIGSKGGEWKIVGCVSGRGRRSFFRLTRVQKLHRRNSTLPNYIMKCLDVLFANIMRSANFALGQCRPIQIG